MRIVECQQYTDEWWKARQGVPTGSEFHRIVTAARWQYAAGRHSYICDLIAETYNPNYGQHEQYVSHAMAKGSYLEPESRRCYEFTEGVEVEQVGFLLSEDGRFGCSPDALVGSEGGLELKSPERKTHIRWLLDGVVPHEHLAQCHGFLVVSERAWIDFMSYCPGLPTLKRRVERNEKTEQLEKYLDDFCGEYQAALAKVKSLEEPEPTKTLDFGSLGTVEVGVCEESYF